MADVTLPPAFPPLRLLAEQAAREAWNAERADSVMFSHDHWRWPEDPPDEPRDETARDRLLAAIRCIRTRAHARLLADLTRPASRDAWARWLAERVGLRVGASAPEWFHVEGSSGRVWWSLGCRARFHDCELGADHSQLAVVHVPGVSDCRDPSAALALALLAVEGSAKLPAHSPKEER